MRPALWARLDPPKRVALMQRAWDSHHTAVRMRAQGFLYRQIGARLGLSVERSRQLCSPWAFRRYNKGPSPIEVWLSGPAGPAMEIIDFWRKHASREMPRMTIRILPVLLLLALPLAAHAAEPALCRAYATKMLNLHMTWLWNRAYSGCLMLEEDDPQPPDNVEGMLRVLTPVEPVMPSPLPRPQPAAPVVLTPPALTGQPLCVKHGKRTIYRGKHWRCVK